MMENEERKSSSSSLDRRRRGSSDDWELTEDDDHHQEASEEYHHQQQPILNDEEVTFSNPNNESTHHDKDHGQDRDDDLLNDMRLESFAERSPRSAERHRPTEPQQQQHSKEEDDDEDNDDEPVVKPRASLSQYMEEASMETILDHRDSDTMTTTTDDHHRSDNNNNNHHDGASSTKIHAAGRMGRRHSAVMEDDIVVLHHHHTNTASSDHHHHQNNNDNNDDGGDNHHHDKEEQSVQAMASQPVSALSSSSLLLHESYRGSFQSATTGELTTVEKEKKKEEANANNKNTENATVSPAPPSTARRNSTLQRQLFASATATSSSITVPEGEDMSVLELLLEYKILPENNTNIEDHPATLLHSLFDGFCVPPLEREVVQQAYDLEHSRAYQTTPNIPFPDQLVLVDPTRIIRLLSAGSSLTHPAMLRLPVSFLATFFRILIRILTNESDEEYNVTCFLTQPAIDTTKPLLAVVGEAPTDPDYAARRPHILYTCARLQHFWNQFCIENKVIHSQQDDRPSLRVLWNFWEQMGAESVHWERQQLADRIVAPLARFIGVLSVAGISPWLLRRMLTACQTCRLNKARISMVRAVRTAAFGSSRPLVLSKIPPQFFFNLSGSTGLHRSLTGLAAWPFRNDFGMALWFRAERFDASNHQSPVLLSVRTDDGGGIQVSLVPLHQRRSSDAYTVAVTTFNSLQHEPARTVTVQGCVLLPSMWYHLAVRHTRSRLKGVFSLSTRQQLSILLDGKVLLTEALAFPIISGLEGDDSASSFLQAGIAAGLHQTGLRRATPLHSRVNLTIRFGDFFNGQTGTLYVFNDHVSDSSFRTLYEATGGNSNSTKRSTSNGQTWDARRGEIVRRSRVLDVSITNDDAEEIVLRHRRPSGSIIKSIGAARASIIDIGEGDDENDLDLPLGLQKAQFGARVFLSWDPRRTVGGVAIDLHVGAHMSMDVNAFAWQSSAAQDVIGSVGGVQLLVPVLRSLLVGENENKALSELEDSHETLNTTAYSPIPDLLTLLAAFVQDHNDNARELLRCGGVDVAEQLIYSNRKSSGGRNFRAVNEQSHSAYLVVQSLLELQACCTHYVGLETKVFSRLLFNIPLWLGGARVSTVDEDLWLPFMLLPVLSLVTRRVPQKVRDCVGTRDILHVIKEVVDDHERINEKNPLELASTAQSKAMDTLLGMAFGVLSTGVTSADLSPFLSLLSLSLDMITINGAEDEPGNTFALRKRFSRSASAAFYFLLQIRPPVPGLLESFAECCGSLQGTVAWILTALVNSSDDMVRSFGVRSVAAVLEVTSRNPDAPLSLSAVNMTTVTSSESDSLKGAEITVPMRGFGLIAKGIAAMNPGIRAPSSSMTTLTGRIVAKLLWHLLRRHRAGIGRHTRASLLCWISDDNGVLLASVSSLSYLESNVIAESVNHQPACVFNLEWGCRLLAETGKVVGRALSNSLALGTVLRLQRFLDGDVQSEWISDILIMTKASRKSVEILALLPDWQPCLFFLLSDSLEALSTAFRRSHYILEAPSKEISTNNHHVDGIAESASIAKRVDLCLELYSTLLGYLLREGGDKALDAVEITASLQRGCVNGCDVLVLILSGLCDNLFDHGTLREVGSMSAADWKEINLDHESPLLKQSARLVTDAILSNGTKGLDVSTAVRSWRSLRHLTEVVVAVATSSGFGIVELFDYANGRGAAVDSVSGGLHGIRLPETRLSSIHSTEYIASIEASANEAEFKRDANRRLCTHLAVQVLEILDSFMFPEAMDEAMPATQLHGLALARNSEQRLGPSHGPLLVSAIRLSLVLVAHLEPCSVRFLQAVGRLRSLVLWSLELIRESGKDGNNLAAFGGSAAYLDRLLLAIVMHTHRALGRCASLVFEIESSLFSVYFKDRETQKKVHRRLLRSALELRDIVAIAYRGRTDVFVSSLSSSALDALKASLEGAHTSSSKESFVKEFLQSQWVSGYQDVDAQSDFMVPEQLCVDVIPVSSDIEQLGLGLASIDALSKESKAIISDFEKALNEYFEGYLEQQRKWAETDAVRELESDGIVTAKRLSEKDASETDIAKTILLRRNGADNRWRVIQRKVCEPWKNELYWMLAPHTDRMGRRTMLVQNRNFDNHMKASYDLLSGRETDEQQQRLLDQRISEVVRRNAQAFVVTEPTDDSEQLDGSCASLSSDSESVTDDAQGRRRSSNVDDSEHDEEWDKIDSEEIRGVDAEGGTDAWAKSFIWSDNESVVARFESVMLVSLRSYVEGHLLLTTHGLYFRQVGEETSSITKEPMETAELSTDSRHRRWRLARLTEVHGRRYMLRPQALELFFSDSHELFINFPIGTKERDRFFAKLRNSCKIPMLWSPKSLNPRTVFRKSRLTEMWKKRKLSNFDYLMSLNRLAGRSFNDLTQYPVFPWILSDYTSETIDLADSRVYRDLTRPIGALNADRLAQLIERYNDLELFGFTKAEKFLYGSHYSSPGTVLHYLIRQEPFTTMAIELQSGRFDCPDRLFFDLAGSWNSCMTSTADMKELIPEFFCLPEMFLNNNKFPLGRTQSGRSIDNVALPPWAKGSPYEFVRIHRLALESEYVSQTLHHWIDLIFGYKQRGQEAELAHNVFHHLSYEGSVDLDKIADDVDRQAAESHIQNFGQTPSQLLVLDPHPSRYSLDLCWKPLIYNLSVPKRLRCYTPSQQFGNKRSEHAKGAVLQIHVLADTVFAVYADLSVGTYKWAPANKTKRLRMDKLRPISRRELSNSRVSIRRGSTISETKISSSCRSVGNWSFAFTIGGHAKEVLRRKTVFPTTNRLISSADDLAPNEFGGLIVSCGFWDDAIRAYSIDSMRQVASERGGHRGAPVRCLAIGQDGGLMVTGGDDGTCCVWVVDHPDMSVALSDGYVQTAIGALNDGEQLLSCCHILWGHESPITCVALDSDLDAVVSGCQGGLLCIHTLRRGDFIRSIYPPAVVTDENPSITDNRGVSRVALHSNGNMVVHTGDKGLHTYTINGVRLCSIDAEEIIHDMKICSQGEILITGGSQCQVLVRTVHDLALCAMLDLSRHGPIRSIGLTSSELNPAPQYLFIGSDDGMITIVEEDPHHPKSPPPGGLSF